MNEFKLGDKVRSRVSGLEGIITAIADRLNYPKEVHVTAIVDTPRHPKGVHITAPPTRLTDGDWFPLTEVEIVE